MTQKDTQMAGTPRWVRVFGTIVLVLVVLVVVMLLTGRGRHGPGRHTPSGDNAPSADISGHRSSTGAHT